MRLGREVRFVGIPLIAKTRGSKMSIGSNCVVNSSFLSNLAGLYQRCILVARDGGELKIGENTGLSGATVYAKESIEIGRDCLIGANAKINVFIGANSIVLKGVSIGSGSVIAAGSVVVKDIPSGVLAGGNPAKVIKELP